MANEKKFEIENTIENEAFAMVEAGKGTIIRETTTTDEITLFNAVNSASTKVKDVLGIPLNIVDIVVTSVDVSDDPNDPDGVKHSRPCCHFFTDDGAHISSISNGVCRATNRLLGFNIIPSTEKPLTIMFTTTETKKGTAHTFTLVK